jgi:drug/metabolite transporter (DMT)-like permease
MMILFRRLWANPYLLLSLTCLMWAGNAVASRLAVGHIAPITLTSLRWVSVCAVLPFLLRHELKQHWPALRANAWLILAMGIFGYTVFNALMYLAAYSTTAINIGILQGSIPVFVLLGAWMAFGTRITAMQMLGVLVTLIGVTMVASRGDWSILRTLTFALGDIVMVIACLFYASYTVALRKRPPMPGLVFFTAMACVACVVSLPLMAAEWALGHGYWPTLKGWLILAYVAIGPSLLSQLFFMRGVELIGPGRAGVFVNLVPVFAAVLGVLILSEPFAWYHAAALVLVLGGIFIAERLGPRADQKNS